MKQKSGKCFRHRKSEKQDIEYFWFLVKKVEGWIF